MPDDADLLRRFAAKQSEDAFTELVTRHIGLVYHSALRQVAGDRHLAEDVTQSVFTLLARKAAAIPVHSVLAAWLFTVTRYTASHLIRDQRRRMRRETEAYTMNEILSDRASDIQWDRVRPELDGLVASLNKKEREAILLRFFQGHSFADVGSQLGITHDAARMRVERALEKLRTVLARRGVSSTSAALSAMLTQEAALATPAWLIPSVTSVALSGLTAAGGMSMFLNSLIIAKIKSGMATVLVASGLFTAMMQERTRAQLRQELVELRRDMQHPDVESKQPAIPEVTLLPSRLSIARQVPENRSPLKSAGSRSPVNDDIPGGLVGRGWLPVSALRDAGRYDAPSAVEAMLWGQAHPESITLASTLWITTVENKVTGKKQWTPTTLTPDSAEFVTAALISKREPFSEVRVIEQVGGGDNAYVTMQFRAADGTVTEQKRRLHVTGDGWKWVPSSEQLDALARSPYSAPKS